MKHMHTLVQLEIKHFCQILMQIFTTFADC